MTNTPRESNLPEDENTTDQQLRLLQERGRRLRSIRKMIGLSRVEFEQKYRLSQHTLRAWERGSRAGLNEQSARNLIELFSKEGMQCSIQWLLYGVGDPPKLFQQLQEDRSPHPYVLSSTVGDADLLAEIEYFHSLHPHAIFMQITDNGMEPFYAVGDYVGGEECLSEQIATLIGYYCIVETFTGEKYCRLLQPGNKSGLYHLLPIHYDKGQVAAILTDVDLLKAAKITRHWAKKS